MGLLTLLWKRANFGGNIMLKRTCAFYLSVVFIGLAVILSGCGKSYSVKPSSDVKLFKKRAETALNSSKPSEQTQQQLRLMFLENEYKKNPEEVIRQLHEQSRDNKDSQLMIPTAELALLHARKLASNKPSDAVAMNLMAASLAYDYLFGTDQLEPADAITPSYRFMADIYNMAVTRLVVNQAKKENPWVDQYGVEIMSTSYDLSINRKARGLWEPNLFDQLIATNDLQVRGIENEYFSKGLGAPMVGIVNNPQSKSEFGKYFPLKGAAFPVTAVVDFKPINKVEGIWKRKVELTFYDSVQTENTIINATKIPLEADYTTPLGVLLSKIQDPDYGLGAMLDNEKYMPRSGIHMLDPYHPKKIPVVLVHGLMSSPGTWVHMFNDLKGDPRIRQNYQFWFFIYPTGLPIIYSASLLRKDLLEIRDTFDPTDSNQNFDEMVIVGHSMGGLLTRLMVQNSESYYWDNIFTVGPDEVSLSESDKEFLQNIMFFETVPFIKRAVFVSTPHRGSKLADKWLGKIGAGFVSLPTNVKGIEENIIKDKSELAIDPKAFMRRVPNGIDLLSPSAPFILTLQKVPVNTNIPYHSIIGVRKAKTGPGSTDGIVSYASSHIDFAVSEKLVPSGHYAHKHPVAIAEVKRILNLHLDELTKPAIAKINNYNQLAPSLIIH